MRSFTEPRSLVSQVGWKQEGLLEVTRGGKTMKEATEIKEQPVDYLNARGAAAPPTTNAAGPATNSANAR